MNKWLPLTMCRASHPAFIFINLGPPTNSSFLSPYFYSANLNLFNRLFFNKFKQFFFSVKCVGLHISASRIVFLIFLNFGFGYSCIIFINNSASLNLYSSIFLNNTMICSMASRCIFKYMFIIVFLNILINKMFSKKFSI